VSGAVEPPVANGASISSVPTGRIAEGSSNVPIGPNARRAMSVPTGIRPCVRNTSRDAPTGANVSRTRIRRSPSLLPSKSSWKPAARSRAEARRNWIASASTSGSGTRGWCAHVRPRHHSRVRVMCASTASASLRQATVCVPAMWWPSPSTGRYGCSRSSDLPNAVGPRKRRAHFVRMSLRRETRRTHAQACRQCCARRAEADRRSASAARSSGSPAKTAYEVATALRHAVRRLARPPQQRHVLLGRGPCARDPSASESC